ncbi:MAG TPA: hypothetical protein VEA15_05360 [Caulobacteraceae bacterium]|nr:hypothetical protein [Caulobacteraceae bacterium]
MASVKDPNVTVDDPDRPSGDPRSFDENAPSRMRSRERGARAGDPDADSVMPGREFGAGEQVDDGPGGAKGPRPGSGSDSRR